MITVLLRTVIVYLIITASVRLMGKRQMAQLQPGEFVITLLISNIATLPLQDTDIPLIGGIIPILCLMALEIFSAWSAARSHRIRRMIYGREKVLIEHGILNLQTMRELRFTADDLMEVLRAQGVFDLRDAEYAIVQANGTVNVCPAPRARPVTRGDLAPDAESRPSDISFVTVSEGGFNPPGLQALKLDEAWAAGILKRYGRAAGDVFLMTANSADDYCIIWKDGSREVSR